MSRTALCLLVPLLFACASDGDWAVEPLSETESNQPLSEQEAEEDVIMDSER